MDRTISFRDRDHRLGEAQKGSAQALRLPPNVGVVPRWVSVVRGSLRGQFAGSTSRLKAVCCVLFM